MMKFKQETPRKVLLINITYLLKEVKKSKFRQSIFRNGNYCDNILQESFFVHLKDKSNIKNY